jgi:AraC family transcriptional regulator, arabinose operon regulatory protein
MSLETKENTVRSFPLGQDRSPLVEIPTGFTFDNCELTLYETLEEASNIGFQFDYPTVAIMLSGRKIMHMEGHSFEFLPGAVFIVSPNVPMLIDLPGASLIHPTLCLTLTINRNVILKQIEVLLKNNASKTSSKQIEYLQDHKEFLLFEENGLYRLAQRIADLAQEKNEDYESIMQIATSELIIRLSQTNSCELLLKSAKVSNVSDTFSKAVNFIHANYTSPISIDKLCSIACVSKAVLFRKFKTAFGLTPVEFILKKKIDAAKELLDSAEQYSIKHISMNCGFNSESYFNQIFKRQVGTTPLAYRNRI